ncbi:MAG TPA: nucleotide exchange factor GrpE [Gaiellaceae bacterium]|nr:nucleotide exchange factor GrpE [Gaiellaceae bacterium]
MRPSAVPEAADESAAPAPEPRSPEQHSGQHELAEAIRQRDEYLDALQRLKAEFDNYRKRVAREEERLVVRASERLVKQLIPMLDDLERAVDAAIEHGELKLEDGVRLVHRSLANMLQREGLSEVDTDGPFDPHTQEALLSQPSDEPEGDVIQVVQKGYRLGDQVLRPARVVVSSGPPSAPVSEDER